MKKIMAVTAVLAVFPMTAVAEELSITMNRISDNVVGETIGTITASGSEYGVLFTPKLEGLSPGLHGFHVHENPSCKPAEKDGKMTAGAAAGGHFDPRETGTHQGPFGEGHLGDLPALYVSEQNRASHPVLAPRLKLSDLKGRALIIHKGGDNYADEPEKLGGGGPRAACGIVE